MEEIRKGNIVELETEDGLIIKGKVSEYTKDRVLIRVDKDSIENAKSLKELDLLTVSARTNYGLKDMLSHVISEIDYKFSIIIENAPTATIEQKRAFVRVTESFNFIIKFNGRYYNAKCLNYSAGGIAFECPDADFKPDDVFEIEFSENIFSKKIVCKATIVKVRFDYFAAKFSGVNEYDENRIVQRVFKILAQK